MKFEKEIEECIKVKKSTTFFALQNLPKYRAKNASNTFYKKKYRHIPRFCVFDWFQK